MYFILGFLIFIAIFFMMITRFRACRIRRKVCALTPCEKSRLLNKLIEPFGFSYCSEQDFFTSRLDAWQRDMGYCSFYDRLAPHTQMVFQCEPIYFNAHGCTWLLEFWKGQYGINTGAEAGLYRAYSPVSPEDYDKTLFHAVPNELMPDFSMELWKGPRLLLRHCNTHWWLTIFLLGCFSKPSDLSLRVSITFPDMEMLEAFTKALRRHGYPGADSCVCCDTITVTFCEPLCPQPCGRLPFVCRFSQWKNKCFCKLYLWATKPFCRSDDRLLYLYFFLPSAFRKTVQFSKPKRYGKGSRKRV